MNLCEIGLFHIVLGASKGTRENYPEIWWKCFNSEIYWYISISGVCEGGCMVPLLLFFLLFIKTEKVQEHDPY